VNRQHDAGDVSRVAPSDATRYFFVRVMRTGSTSMTWHMRRILGARSVYPSVRLAQQDMSSAVSVERLLEHWKTGAPRLRAVAGHFPLSTSELLDAPFRTLTILRHPVERTLSQLRHRQSAMPELAGISLAEIYVNSCRLQLNIDNHMVKLFSLAPDEVVPLGLWTQMTPTRDRLERAKRALARVDVVGLQEHFDAFSAMITETFGWTLHPPIRVNTTEAAHAPDELRKRIADDNALDLELYAFARDLVEARSK